MTIFPFTLPHYDGKSLFRAYVQKNREHLNEKYGRMCLTTVDGVTGHYRLWSYYEVDVEVLTATEVRFTTYSMDDPVYGGRGAPQETIHATLKPGALDQYIEAEQRRVATQTYHARQAALLAKTEAAEIEAVYKEMFP